MPHARVFTSLVMVLMRACRLHGETLATLSATAGENGTATLGGHTGAEAVGLGALALVRLVRTLHDYYPPVAFKQSSTCT